MTYSAPSAVLRFDADDPHARVVVSYREAAARDPRRSGFGYLAADPGSGAIGPFLWFASPTELLDGITTIEVALLQFEEPESARIVGSLERAIGTTRDIRRLDRRAISDAFEGWCEILWIGTFADLCERGGVFQTTLRADFRADCDLGEHGGPITEDELERFVAYLAAGATS